VSNLGTWKAGGWRHCRLVDVIIMLEESIKTAMPFRAAEYIPLSYSCPGIKDTNVWCRHAEKVKLPGDSHLFCCRQQQRAHRRKQQSFTPCRATLTTGPRTIVAPGEGDLPNRRGAKQRQMTGKVGPGHFFAC
jgi:hypothetical protein